MPYVCAVTNILLVVELNYQNISCFSIILVHTSDLKVSCKAKDPS